MREGISHGFHNSNDVRCHLGYFQLSFMHFFRIFIMPHLHYVTRFYLVDVAKKLLFGQVLIASGAPTNDSNPSGSTVEAPLTINIPNCQSSRDTEQPSCSMQGTNITVPVSVQKQPAPSTTVTEGLVSNGSAGGNFNKRKRKPWSEAEDMELIAAVQKCGEGNWANMLRGDFKGDRSASQLSQVF